MFRVEFASAACARRRSVAMGQVACQRGAVTPYHFSSDPRACRRFAAGHRADYFLPGEVLLTPLTSGLGPSSTMASPPAFWIFSRAERLKRWAEIFSFFVKLAVAQDLQHVEAPVGQVLCAAASRASLPRRLSKALVELADVDRQHRAGPVRCGSRAWECGGSSGEAPPSKIGGAVQPASWPWPLWPRPLVLPWPEPGPRPTRLRFLCL